MFTKVLTVILSVMLLCGCATARKGQDIQLQQLQGRIESLEAELEGKNQQIIGLENELQKSQDAALSSSRKKTGSSESGSSQLSVRQVQTALKNAGYYKGAIDGKMGPQTKESVRSFQEASGLKVDGIVGGKTAERLNKYLTR